MAEQTTETTNQRPIVGFDPDVAPLLGVGLGLTGLTLGLRPRFAMVPLAITAAAAMLYRDPERITPDDRRSLYAAADGLVLALDEQYEHRYLHTDAIRIITLLSPFDVPVSRSPVDGVVEYCEHVSGERRGLQQADAAEINTRTYIGLTTAWGHVLMVQVAGPLSRRIACRVKTGEYVDAGTRIGTARFGSRTDILVPRDTIRPLVQPGQRMTAGETRLAVINA